MQPIVNPDIDTRNPNKAAHANTADLPQSGLRAPADVMRLSRMGQSFPHRLSFSRQIIRRIIADKASVSRPVWDMCDQGYGRAVYSLSVGGHTYSLVAISSPLDDENRSDRVIAEAWDACFCLFDGVPTPTDLDRLAANQVRQEAGRFSDKELTLSRANKSMRLFGYVRDCLAAGQQPLAARLNEIGYLMRTTAVYGNGKFGIADRHDYAARPGMSAPFQAEMLTVWLIRGFTHDLVEHCAKAINPDAAALAPELKRHLGVGNSTGLGMAPFLVHHPELLHRWVQARERAFAKALADDLPVPQHLVARARAHLDQWQVADQEAQAHIDQSRIEMAGLMSSDSASTQSLWHWAQTQSVHSQELIASLILECDKDSDALQDDMSAQPSPIDVRLSTADLARLIRTHYGWALADAQDEHWFWYVSENKLEPRIGARAELEGAELERPLCVVRNIRAMLPLLEAANLGVQEWLAQRPEFFQTAMRVIAGQSHPYGEIRENLLGPDLRPIDMLRFKLSFFGATKFDPKSDLWTRIALFQGAPTRDDLNTPGDDWWLAAL